MPLYNDQNINSSSTVFVPLYAPSTTWGNIIDMNLGYPGLRGYWPMTGADENDDTYDFSEQGRKMVHYP